MSGSSTGGDVVALPFAWSGSLHHVERARVTQCALSRICGVCREPLGRPIAFVGTPDEVGRNAFHLPPLHVGCAETLLGYDGADPTWSMTTTAAFEFVRPGRDDLDREPRFEPSALL